MMVFIFLVFLDAHIAVLSVSRTKKNTYCQQLWGRLCDNFFLSSIFDSPGLARQYRMKWGGGASCTARARARVASPVYAPNTTTWLRGTGIDALASGWGGGTDDTSSPIWRRLIWGKPLFPLTRKRWDGDLPVRRQYVSTLLFGTIPNRLEFCIDRHTKQRHKERWVKLDTFHSRRASFVSGRDAVPRIFPFFFACFFFVVGFGFVRRCHRTLLVVAGKQWLPRCLCARAHRV